MKCLCKTSKGDVFFNVRGSWCMEGKRRMRAVTVVNSEEGEKKVCRGQCSWGGGGQASGETEEVRPFTFIYT